ncbi:amidohydrolase family protein [Piscinibacter sakaiensis]|uniref:amidohydrolase family protein n=1 Tax=Piscinibacter sakaiensis TaxID=1547922 RepID=UPI003AAA22B5
MQMTPKPRFIDAHCHVWPAHGVALVPGMSPYDRQPNAYPIEAHLDRLGALGIEATVLVPHIGYYHRDLGYAFECAKRFPGRIAVMGAITQAECEDPTSLAGDFDLGVRSFRIRFVDLQRPLDNLCESLATQAAVLCPLITRTQAMAGALNRVIELAAGHPRLRFAIDHFAGWPEAPAWTSLAALPNVLVKVSDFAAFDVPPYWRALEATLNMQALFGADRLMWGSNLPVFELDAVQRLDQAFNVIETARGMSGTDKAAILGGTAARTFFNP